MENLFDIASEYKDLRASVRALAEKEIAPFAKAVDEDHRFPQEAADALQKAGLAAAHVPTEFGGDGADALAVVIIIEEVARVCGASSLIPAVNKLGSLPLMLGGNKDQKQRWLSQLAQGKGFSYCLSESDAGSDASALRTKVERDGDSWILNGSKKWISNAGISEFYTVIAQGDASLGSKGITAFVVEKSDPGVSFGAPAQGALDVATKYSHERKQFGKEIFDFQGVQFMLADMAMNIEAARQLTYVAASKSESNEKDLRFFSAASKCFASDVAMKVTTDAVQILGGYGYVSDYPVERMMRDAKLTQIYEGTNQIQRIVMARNLPNA